ncbi:MAG: zinc-binding dehydrogenase [Armatimonadetes bacterium]|nr:zinc-binding dehydrogenase [Armatimonadota bacterium]
MKSLRFMGNSQTEIVDLPVPKPKADEVLLRIRVSALCGSEMGSWRGPNGMAGNGGHEYAGDVVDANGTCLAEGDRVGVHVVIGCGKCVQCKTGNEIFCDSKGFVGSAHAEYVAVPARACLKLPDNIDWDTGVLIAGDSMGVGYHLTRRVGLQASETVAIFGMGPIGLGALLVWDFLGARVIGVDMSDYRRKLAEKLGAWKTVNADKKTVERLRKLTGGAGPDTCLECTGKPDPVATAFEAVRNGGKLGIVGEQGNACFNPSRDLIHKEVNVYGAWYFRLHEFPGMVELCNRGLKPKKMVTHRFPLDEAQKGYELMAAGKTGKVLFVQY